MVAKIKPVYFLLTGIVTITAAHLTISIDMVAWIACVPFLIYLHETKSVRSKLFFVTGLMMAWSVCIAKILSPPMPLLMVFLYAVPISLFQLPGYLLWNKFKNRRGAVFLFPAVMTLMEWIQYTYTPLASWGVAAYTQIHSITIVQVVSLFGMPGLSFIIYWVNISIADIVLKKTTTFLNLTLPAAVTAVLIVFGALRFDLSKMYGIATIKVAAVGTDSDVMGFPLPAEQINETVKQNLFNRTMLAASGGAKLVVWNEASAFILPNDEKAWIDTLAKFSARLKVAIVAAYIVPVSELPALYKNKYLFFDSTGTLRFTYHKHQPVPGEPAKKGTEQLKVANVSGTRTGAVICYDYDFPYLAAGLGKLNADLVADPSSDWRGIDPIHTKMAAFRAVEQGHSILRSARFGLSAAITPYGAFAAEMSSFDNNNKIMIADLPAKKITTVYAVVGDLFVCLCAGFIAFFIVQQLWFWKNEVAVA